MGVGRVALGKQVVGGKAALVLGHQQGVAELGRVLWLALADRPDIRISQRHHAIGDAAVAGKPLVGLPQQPPGERDGLVELAGQPRQPPVAGPTGGGAVGGAADRGDLAQALPGDGGDLGGEPVDLTHGDAGAPPQRVGELAQPASGRAAAVPERGPACSAARLEAPHQPAEGAHRLLEQVGVGRVVDVGLHDGGVDPEFAGAQQLVGGQLAQQRGVELLDHARAGATHQLAQGSGVWDGPVQGDAAEPAPGDRVANLLAQALVAELVAVLQVQQAQQGRRRDRGAAQPRVEVPAPRGEEALVVEVGVDAGKLVGEAFGLVGQQVVPGGQRRGGGAKQRDLLQQRQRCHSTTTTPVGSSIPAPMRSGRVKGAWKI